MEFKGWVRTSLIDYPEHIACVLFTGGCNFRCPPCHNVDLVLRPGELPALPEDVVWDFLVQRAGRLEGVVLTGGEPTLQPELVPFLRRLRDLPLEVKLDTNGYLPDVLAEALAEGLLDYVALDIKAPREKYPLLAGRVLELEYIERSIALLRRSGIPHEFRTTVVPGLLTEEDIETIACWVVGAELYVLQQFRPHRTLDPTLEQLSPHPAALLQEMARRAQAWVENVEVRRG